MDLDDVERIDTEALGGANDFVAPRSQRSDLTALDVRLGAGDDSLDVTGLLAR